MAISSLFSPLDKYLVFNIFFFLNKKVLWAEVVLFFRYTFELEEGGF